MAPPPKTLHLATPQSGGDPQSIADADLVARAIDDEQWAMAALFRRHCRPVAGLVSRLLGTTRDVEDVLHEAFLTAIEKLDELDDPAAFRPWLTQIAVNQARRKLRRARLERFLGLYQGDDDATLERLASRAASPEVRADLAFIDDVLRQAPPNRRMAWILRVVEGRSVREVAELMDSSPSTTKRRIRAVQKRIEARVRIKGGRRG